MGMNQKYVTSFELSKQLKEAGIRDSMGRFTKGSKPLSGFKVGHKTNVGKKLTEEHKKRIGVANKGKITYMKGKKMTEESKIKISQALKGKPLINSRGSNHYNWKGGLSDLRKRIRHLVEYKNWRDLIFQRDNYTCVLCKARSGNGKKIILNADHYPITFAEIIHTRFIKTIKQAVSCSDLWDTNNGRTLCVSCHKKHLYEQ